jgi:hypothetical protein
VKVAQIVLALVALDFALSAPEAAAARGGR